MSQCKMVQNADDLSALIQEKSMELESLAPLLFDELDKSRWDIYQQHIKDLIAVSVEYWCNIAIKSKWQVIPQDNLYDRINRIDDLLSKMAQALADADKEQLKRYHKNLNVFLEKLIRIE